MPFGVVNDPLGRPTERGMAVLAHAGRRAAGGFLRSFMQGVWAEGLDAGATAACGAWPSGPGWAARLCAGAGRHLARGGRGHNRREMASLGLWGVPSFRVGTLSVMGPGPAVGGAAGVAVGHAAGC